MNANAMILVIAAWFGLSLSVMGEPIVIDDDDDRDKIAGPDVVTVEMSNHNNGDWGSGAQYFNQTNAYNGSGASEYRGGTPGNAVASATYTFDAGRGVVAGKKYNVYATWAQNGQGNTGPAVYTVSDGLGSVAVDQRVAVADDIQIPDPFVGDVKNFQLLGTVTEDGDGVITITLSNDGANFFIVDAVAIEEPPLYWDGTSMDGDANGGAGTWDVGTSTNWDDAPTGGADVAWIQGQSASFGGNAGGTVTLSEAITVNSLAFNVAGYELTGSSLTIDGGVVANQDVTISSALVGMSPLTKSGAGTLTFSGDGSGFTELLTVASGRFDLGGSVGGSVVVEDAGTIAGEGAIAGDLQLGTFGGTGATLAFDSSTSAALSANNLTLEAVTKLVMDGTPVFGTPVDVISYTGTLTNNTGFPVEEAFSIPLRNVITENGQTIEITITAPESSTWTGNASGFWSLADTLEDGNWSSSDNYFYNGDAVTFDDGAPGIVAVDSSEGALAPGSVTFANSLGNDYTIEGNGIGGTGNLTKNGGGTVFLSQNNSFTGGTTVNDGRLVLAETSGDSVGVLVGTVTVNAPGILEAFEPNSLGWGIGTKVDTLNLNGSELVLSQIGDNGWGITVNLADGATISNQDGTNYMSLGSGSAINVTGDTTATISALLQLREGTETVFDVADGAATIDLLVSGELFGGRGFTKTGDGTMALTEINTYTGDTTVEAGVLSLTVDYLDDIADVNLSGNAVLDLQHDWTDTIDEFRINGVAQAAGTWGALGNAMADHTTARITGNGLLDVFTGGVSEGIMVLGISKDGDAVAIEFAGGSADVYSSLSLLAPWTQLGTDVAPPTFDDESATEAKKFYLLLPAGSAAP